MRPVFLVAALIAVPATAAAAAAPASPLGVWSNAAGSVRIRIAPYGGGLCGTVVQASDQAKEDAAAGGTDRLIGTALFRDLRRDSDGVWAGEVFVPDLGRSVEGTLEQRDPRTLVATGCLIAGLACKSQTWTRVAAK